MTEPVRLYTFSVSHFSEKIRWVLALEGIAFDDVRLTPGLHVPRARRLSGRTTLPILECAGERVRDSTRIVHWLEQHRGPLRLLPRDPAARDAALAAEERFDHAGDHVLRYAYHHVLSDTAGMVRIWGIDATPAERFVLRASFPVLRALFRRRLSTTPEKLARSREVIESALALVEEPRESRYVVGDALSIADVTAAALLAPLACPDEHPVYSSAFYRASVTSVVAPWRDRPALAWVRSMYRDHRGVWPGAEAVRARLA